MSHDLTAELRVLDCPHAFNGIMVVHLAPPTSAKADECPESRAADSPTPVPPAPAPDAHWRLVLFADRAAGGCDVISHAPVRFCPLCAQPLTPHTPTRNYVVGVNVPVDEHLAGVSESRSIK